MLRAKAEVKSLQLLRNSRVQLQCKLEVDDSKLGDIQLQLSEVMARAMLGGDLGLGKCFYIDLVRDGGAPK